MTNRLTTRALGTAFAASLLLGAAACGDDDTTDPSEEPEIDEGLGGTDNEDSGIETGEGLGGTEESDVSDLEGDADE